MTGTDKSAALIAAARAASAGRRAAARFSEADLADLPFSDASFDLAVVNHMLNDLPDITARWANWPACFGQAVAW